MYMVQAYKNILIIMFNITITNKQNVTRLHQFVIYVSFTMTDREFRQLYIYMLVISHNVSTNMKSVWFIQSCNTLQ